METTTKEELKEETKELRKVIKELRKVIKELANELECYEPDVLGIAAKARKAIKDFEAV